MISDGTHVENAAEKLLGARVDAVSAIGGGRNSRVYLVTTGPRQFAAKWYFRDRLENRRRLEVEFGTLRFLREHGCPSVPEPFLSDPDLGLGIYEYITGDKITAETIGDADVEAAVRFLVELNRLARLPEAEGLPAASDAWLSPLAPIAGLHRRFCRISKVESQAAVYRALAGFLKDELAPMLATMTVRYDCHYAEYPIAGELPVGKRTLSPSDFGFHNALRRPDGQLAFLDFEYFGWDDPAKMICDFLLHPGMALSHGLKQRFVEVVVAGLDSPALATRLAAIFPLCCLHWSLIVLNEFIPEDLERRAFAADGIRDRAAVQYAQLEKARAFLRMAREGEVFPYVLPSVVS